MRYIHLYRDVAHIRVTWIEHVYNSVTLDYITLSCRRGQVLITFDAVVHKTSGHLICLEWPPDRSNVIVLRCDSLGLPSR